jgi:hypothetical protein
MPFNSKVTHPFGANKKLNFEVNTLVLENFLYIQHGIQHSYTLSQGSSSFELFLA